MRLHEIDPKKAIKYHIAERIHLTVSEIVDRKEMFERARLIMSRSASIANTLIFDLGTYVAGMPEEQIDVEERWPDGWWEAIKDRWFPRWLQRWFPVKYREISIHQTIYKKVCPHISLDEQQQHLS